MIDAQDIKDAVDYLIKDNQVSEKVAITGGSAGGYAVQRALTLYPDTFKVGASYFGIGNIITLATLTSLVIIGGIYSGTVTPMEASAVGATGAIVSAAIHRRLTWIVLKGAMYQTLQISSMIAWLLIGIGMFSAVYSGIGALELAEKIAGAIPGGGWGVIFITQLALIFFGMFLKQI